MKLFHDTLGSKIVRGEKSCCIPSSLRAKWFSLLQKTYGADTSSWTEFDLAAIGDLLITVPEQDLAKIPRDSLSRAINPFLTQSGFDQLILIPGRSRKQRFITVCAESLGADGDEYSSAYKNLIKHWTEGAQVLANTVKSPEELVRTHSTRTGRTPRWAEFNKADGANPVPPQVDLGQSRPVQTRSFFDKDKEIFLQSPRPQPYQYQNPNPSVPFQDDISAAGQVNFNANQQNQFQTRSFDKGLSGQPVVDIQQPYQYQSQNQSPGDLSFRKDFAVAGQINVNSGQPQTRSFLDKDVGIPQQPQPYQQNPTQGDISFRKDLAFLGSKITDPQVLTVLADKFNADNSIFPGTPKNTRPDNLRIIVSSLGNIICGFSDKVVNSIFETDPALFIDCSPNLRNIEGCPIDVLSPLATHAVRPSNYGPPRVWTEEDLETIGVIFAGLKDDAISSIPPESMQGLQPNAIRFLPVESLRALRPEQLTRISYPAAKAFTQVQLNNLNTEQVGALKRALQLLTDKLQVTSEDEARQEETRAVDQGQGPNQGVATGRTKGGDEPDTDPEPGTEAPQDTPTSTVSPTTATGPTTQSPHTTKSPESETETGSKEKSAAVPLTSKHFTQNHLLVILILTLTQWV